MLSSNSIVVEAAINKEFNSFGFTIKINNLNYHGKKLLKILKYFLPIYNYRASTTIV